MTTGPLFPDEERRRLEAELKRARREIDQIHRVAVASEELSMQSKRAMLRANEELQTTVAKLRATTVAAERASEAKSRFLATMSHEIRTPMNCVIGGLELLERSGLTEEQVQLVQLMNGSARSLLALINDILDFAKIEAGKTTLEQIDFSLMDCLEGVVAQESHLAERQGVQLEIQVASGVPMLVRGDPYRLRQVLTNLVSNAVKFTRDGSVLVAAALPESGAPDRIAFAVEDTGIGIEPEVLELIFRPFTQADSGTTRLFGGTGLGLSISQKLVALMGGELAASSEPGKGSTFRFECLMPAADVDSEPAGGDDRPEVGPCRSFTERVLVVDDTPVNRLITEKMLQRLGCEVTSAGNGREALERVEGERFDLVLMDCSMPVMDGYEATLAMRGRGGWLATIPIVALTAFAMKGDRDRCLEAGMTEYLTKPVKMAELEQVLERVAQARGPGDERRAG